MRRSTELPRVAWFAAALCALAAPGIASADREIVLKQIALPHDYYFREMYLPQVTSGPSSLSWSPDGRELVFSMQGSLWRQSLDTATAVQISAGPGYDYQPDWSPDGRHIVFAKYLDDAVELYLLDTGTGAQARLTQEGAVNVEPRWSRDGSKLAWVSTQGTGHFHVFTGVIENGRLSGRMLRPERESEIARYYYSPFDHELSPSWSPDGRELLFIANPETRYGTGGLWRMNADGSGKVVPVRIEETTWKARPDWSPDGRRVIWSSYAGRQWHQLWATTATGGDPLSLSYGEFDITGARWSPDAARIAFLSNEIGDTAIWVQETAGGARRQIAIEDRLYLKPMGELKVEVHDTGGKPLAARIAVTGADGHAYAPDDAWLHADDGFDRKRMPYEMHYFHTDGNATLKVSAGQLWITVWRGLEHRITRRPVEVEAGQSAVVEIVPEPLPLPPEWKVWTSGDVHVHMNYGGHYRNTPERLARQMSAEDLDVVYNLVVNKEQRIPDVGYFSTRPDPVSGSKTLLLHAQEFHTSLWGHLGLLGLEDHFLLPDYAAYEGTAAASPYPSNAVVADLAHGQNAMVGYVHPFGAVPAPDTDAMLANSLPVDAVLGKVDYYEVVAFSDHRASAEVWHRLLNCGIRLSAAAGTDAMANFASLRGPVGMNRVYVRTAAGSEDPSERSSAWLAALRAGHSMATNGPLLGFSVEDRGPGEEMSLPSGTTRVRFKGWLRTIVPVDHLEIVMNGKVVKRLSPGRNRDHADFDDTLDVRESGWVLLRAWNDGAHPDIFDIYPYATTNPVFINVPSAPMRGQCDTGYFLRWLDRIAERAATDTNYNSVEERRRIEDDVSAARAVFERIID